MMRCFRPGERFELPDGRIVFARVTLMAPATDLPGRAHPAYQITVDGILAEPGLASYIDDAGHRGTATTLRLSPLDVGDLRPVQ